MSPVEPVPHAMHGYLALILHAHLPFVRHPEHDRFLEENWLFEAIAECYLPLLEVLEGWRADRLPARITLSLSPTLCAMLRDPLLQDRFDRHLAGLAELAAKELYRTHWEPAFHALAAEYSRGIERLQAAWRGHGRDLVGAFRRLQEAGCIEIITCAATHALLPLLAAHPASLRAQVLVARDFHRECFGTDPRGIWLPECAYTPAVEGVLQEANLRWYTLDTHGLLHATPRPRYGVFAPVYTPNGLAAFARDLDSAKQVWSRHEGYPGDPAYRDFYRDIGFDLDLDYLRPHLPAAPQRSFTGFKYWAITAGTGEKQVYDPAAAAVIADRHADDFLRARTAQIRHLQEVLGRPPILVAPYDAELFGHWWHEGPLWLDRFVRKAVAAESAFQLVTPTDYLAAEPTQQVATPSASSWGEEGYYKVWLNETNEWIYPHLQVAQERMTALARAFPEPDELQARALRQAGRELLLAQSSDWPFILRTGTSPAYARRRVKDHLLRFLALHEQLTSTRLDPAWLARIEACDNLFPNLDWRHWA